MKPTHTHTNRLIHATSPYLLQHAHNPVDWYEWGEEAFAKAIKEDKPIFLSIGYSACHWCHVMEHESFEQEDVARVLNEKFVAIKVDREERPDVDDIYMHYTVQRTGHGGWPMSVFLTPQRVPFWAGTYFPKAQFIQVCNALSDTWKNDRSKILDHATEVDQYMKEWARGDDPIDEVVPRETISRAARFFADRFDPELGGFNTQGNKFPPSMAMELMLREFRRSGDERLKHLVMLTLDQMAYGGIYDQLGGGICRYSTDPEWLVPHFEKMLYDQALVASIYLDAYQVSGKELYARVATEILDFVIRELQSPEGGYYSTLDADSEGMEGKYYIWTVEQVREVLAKENVPLFCDYFDVTPQGNWEERHGHAPPGPKNILRVKVPLEEFARDRGLDARELEAELDRLRAQMLLARQLRVRPGLDDKVLSGWNGLMISTMAKGARVLSEPRFAESAGRAADFVLGKMRSDGRLLGTYRAGKARLTAYLTDYAFMIDGLLNLYEATFDVHRLSEAEALNEVLTRHYFDKEGGGYYFNADDAEALIARTKSSADSAIPSGNSVQAANLIRLAIYTDRKELREMAQSIFKAFGHSMTSSPFTYERMLCSLDLYWDQAKEIVLAGSPNDAQFGNFLGVIYSRYLPNKIVAHVPSEATSRAATARWPLFTGKNAASEQPTAYLCFGYTCRQPTTSPAELAAQLEGR